MNGIKSVIEPMTTIATLDGADSELSLLAQRPQQLQAIVATSGYSLRALRQHASLKTAPLWVISDVSQRKAKALGFQTIHTGGTDARTLADKLITGHKPEDGSVLYIRAVHAAFDLAAKLREHGFRVEEHIAYEAKAATALRHETVLQITQGHIMAASFFSKRTLEIFMQLPEQKYLAKQVQNLACFCLSAEIARLAGKWPWASIHACAAPSQQTMLEQIKAWHAQQNET